MLIDNNKIQDIRNWVLDYEEHSDLNLPLKEQAYKIFVQILKDYDNENL